MTATAIATPAAAGCVTLRGIRASYGTHVVLDRLDWSLREGQVVGLLGRNGSGKTTLIETLLGLREPQDGDAKVFGQFAEEIDDGVRARIGYVPQRSDLFDWLTPDQLLAYFRSFYPRWNTAKVDGLMSRWDIARDRPIGRLSGGQQQRLSIIRALAHDPALLVLDEPVASLDPAGRRDFLRELVEQVVDRNTTVVFSTHILSDLERVAFDVAFLQGGRIALHAPLDELLDSSMRLHGEPRRLQDFLDAHGLVGLDGVSPARVVVPPVPERSDRMAPVHAFARHVRPGEPPVASDGVSMSPVTLEELFLELTE
jgi:ABC-2 type transport system ATP-binding protein